LRRIRAGLHARWNTNGAAGILELRIVSRLRVSHAKNPGREGCTRAEPRTGQQESWSSVFFRDGGTRLRRIRAGLRARWATPGAFFFFFFFNYNGFSPARMGAYQRVKKTEVSNRHHPVPTLTGRVSPTEDTMHLLRGLCHQRLPPGQLGKTCWSDPRRETPTDPGCSRWDAVG
jgi:hypothetical protein